MYMYMYLHLIVQTVILICVPYYQTKVNLAVSILKNQYSMKFNPLTF